MASSFSKPAASPATEKCANKGCSNDLDTTGKPKWCRACRAAYQRERQILYAQDSEKIGFNAGAIAMRNSLLAVLLQAHPNGRMLVHEVASFISTAELPGFPGSNAEGNRESGA
jgi:hypothetical protein